MKNPDLKESPGCQDFLAKMEKMEFRVERVQWDHKDCRAKALQECQEGMVYQA